MATATVLETGDTGSAATTATTDPIISPAADNTELVLLILGNGTPATPSGWTPIGGNAYRAAAHNGTVAISAPDSTGPIGWIVWRVTGIVPGPVIATGTASAGAAAITNPSDVMLAIVASAGATFTPTPAGTQTGASWWPLAAGDFTTTYDGTAYVAFGLAWAEAAVTSGGGRHRSYRLNGHR